MGSCLNNPDRQVKNQEGGKKAAAQEDGSEKSGGVLVSQ
jgi:hypothetical protein